MHGMVINQYIKLFVSLIQIPNKNLIFSIVKQDRSKRCALKGLSFYRFYGNRSKP